MECQWFGGEIKRFQSKKLATCTVCLFKLQRWEPGVETVFDKGFFGYGFRFLI